MTSWNLLSLFRLFLCIINFTFALNYAFDLIQLIIYIYTSFFLCTYKHIHISNYLVKRYFSAATNKQASATPATTSVRFKCQNTNERQNKIDEIRPAREREIWREYGNRNMLTSDDTRQKRDRQFDLFLLRERESCQESVHTTNIINRCNVFN